MLSVLLLGSLIGGFRSFGGGLRPGCRPERDLSESAMGQETGVRGQESGDDAFFELFRHAGEDFVTIGGDQDVVFNTDAEGAGKINAWFDRDDHAGGQLSILVGRQSRQLMHLKADAVAEAMIE